MNIRKLRLESLEERTLLSVTAGGIEQATIVAPTEAQIWIVNTTEDSWDWTADDDIVSLREAIDRSAEGDTVTFAQELSGGTIVLGGSEIVIDKGIRINATAINGITVDANQESRVFNVSGGTEEQPVEILGLTIVGGGTNDEGSIYNLGILNLNECSITENFGSGIFNHGGILTLTNSDVSRNSGSSGWGGGGGIYNEDGTLILVNCIVSENVATGYGYGGGICSMLGTVTLTDCAVSKNTGTGSSYSVGGGIHVEVGSLNLFNCIVSENYADYWGGVFITDMSGSTLKSTISNCVITQNSAITGAGIALIYAPNVSIKNCTISGNTANDCGGIYSISTSPEIVNSIISNNYGGDYSFGTYNTYTGTNNILGFDPGFKVAPEFDDFGNIINSETLDLSLSGTSIAIDAGNNSAVNNECDIVGEPRIVASRSEQSIVDIGAYEYQYQSDSPFKTITVTTNSDTIDDTDDQISLREAVLYANDGDVIIFDSCLTGQTITLSGSSLEIAKWLTIDANSIGGISIDANKESRVFDINSELKSLKVSLTGLTICHGFSDVGGGILNGKFSTLSLIDCCITDSNSGNGGGVYNAGNMTLVNCSVTNNAADNRGGGGVYNSGYISLINCSVTDNSASESGGGIYGGYDCTVSNTIIANNTAQIGGGIYNRAKIVLDDCFIEFNTAYDEGGGIYNDGYSLILRNSVISDNESDYGGGIYNSGEMKIESSLLYANKAKEGGGGGVYASWHANSTLINCTISGNCAQFGGGIVVYDTTTIINSIVSMNYATSTKNDISGNYYGSNNIIGIDPGFKSLPMFDEEGNITNSELLDFSLSETSIAIDSGDNKFVETDHDVSGCLRVFNARRIEPVVDIGAFEYQSKLDSELPSTLVTTNLDIVDISDGLISLREAIFYAVDGDTIIFDQALADNTICLNGNEILIDKNITIDASSIGGIVIDANAASRVFYVIGGQDEKEFVNLIALTITGGLAKDQNGGGIYNASANLSLTGCMITGNVVTGSYRYNGGGIYNESKRMLDMNDCILINNSSNGYGGGVYNVSSSTLSLNNCTISGNSSDHGGGICNDREGLWILTNCNIFNNSAYQGGGVYNYTNGDISLVNCCIYNNNASYGSGIYNAGSVLRLENTTVVQNNQHGIYNGDVNGYISYGSGYSEPFHYDGIVSLYNSIVAENKIDVSSSGSVYGYNSISSYSDWTVSDNCLVYDSTFPLFEDAENSDFALAADSQAINKGNNEYVAVETDLAGNPRIVDNIVDLGAYEYQIVKPSITDVSLIGWMGYEDGSPHTVKLTDPLYDTDVIIFACDGETYYQYPPAFYDPGIYNVSVIVSRKGYKDWNGSTVVEIREHNHDQLVTPTILTGNKGVYVSYGANRHQITWNTIENAVGYELTYASDNRDGWTSVITTETNAVITGLTYGDEVAYRVRALGEGSYADSEWSEGKPFAVCPMDINGDGDISGLDRAILAQSWLAEEGEEDFIPAADIDGNGDVAGTDRAFLANNWLNEVGIDDMIYPRPLAADVVFAEFASADLDVDLDVF